MIWTGRYASSVMSIPALHRVSHGHRKTSGLRDEGSAGPAGPVREGRFVLCRVAGTENPADIPTMLVSVDEMRVKLRGIGAVVIVRGEPERRRRWADNT